MVWLSQLILINPTSPKFVPDPSQWILPRRQMIAWLPPALGDDLLSL